VLERVTLSLLNRKRIFIVKRSLIKIYQLEISRLVFLQNKFGIDAKEYIAKLRENRDKLLTSL